jgi:hypothetical protein
MRNSNANHIRVWIVVLKTALSGFAWAMPSLSWASEVSSYRQNPIDRPFGQSAALLGGGTAASADLSTIDHNPAGLSMGRVVSVEGATAWRKNNIQSSEVGVVDSVMSSVAAGLKFRQTSSAGGFMERRFTLGLADKIASSGITFGLAGDYKERPKLDREGLLQDKANAFEGRAGLLYAWTDRLRIGLRSGGHFDDQVQPEHAVGVAAFLGSHFVASADQLFSSESALKTAFGVGVLFNKYFDLRTSYAVHSKDSKQEGAAGLFLVSPKAAVFYVATLPEVQGPVVEHQVGMRLNMVF